MLPLHFPLKGALLTIASSGILGHLCFNRWEPHDLLPLSMLLFGLPGLLSSLLLPQYSPAHAIAASFAIYWTSLLTSIVIYRFSPFHPLARYPGPIVHKLTQFWFLHKSLGGKVHLHIQELHNQYGDIVRIGPNELSIRDVSAIAPLMGTTGLPKGSDWDGRVLHSPLRSVIAVRDPVEHAHVRKSWSRGLNTHALKEYKPILAARVTQLLQLLVTHATEHGSVDFAETFSFFTYDFMSDMAFGGGTEMMRDGDRDGLWKVLEDGLSMAVIFKCLPWLAHFAKYIPGAGQDLRRMRQMGFKQAKIRLEKGAIRKDLFHYLNNEDGAEDKSPSPSQVSAEGILAIIAGSDTTAATLSSAVNFILNHPEVYTRLREEVDKYYPPGEDALDPKHYSDMHFLQAVIDETLRLLPAVLSGSQRAPIPGSGGRVVGPYYIPEGNQARIHFYSVQRDPRNFSPFPESFWPDRWLIANGIQAYSGEFTHNPNAFIPFSFGPYNCAGKNLALLEMKMVLCTCVQKLDMRFADGWDPLSWERDLEDMFVVKRGRLPLGLKWRDGA